MADLIQFKRGSLANWTELNPVLYPGEPGFIKDALPPNNFKIGDGVTPWNDLPFIGKENNILINNIIQIEKTEENIEDIILIEQQIEEQGVSKNNGDIAIIKTLISNGKYSYTSYVYDAELDTEDNDSYGWAAMDGNYNASNVFLKNKIELAGNFSSIGNYNKGKTIAAGTSLETLLSEMLQQELYPTSNDKPSAVITVNGDFGEVGKTYTLPTATLKIIDVGSYEYGDKTTGISFSIGNVELSQGSNKKKNDRVMVKDSVLKLQAIDSENIFTDEEKTYVFSAIASYDAAKIPVTNLGNLYPGGQIPAGEVPIESKIAKFTGYRLCSGGSTNTSTINSEIIRSKLEYTKTKLEDMDSEDKSFVFYALEGDDKIFFAYPSSWTNKTPYFEMFGIAWNENKEFVLSGEVQVADYRGSNPDGSLNGPAPYKLFLWELDEPLSAEETKFRVWFK